LIDGLIVINSYKKLLIKEKIFSLNKQLAKEWLEKAGQGYVFV
jgi:hypothetical protein